MVAIRIPPRSALIPSQRMKLELSGARALNRIFKSLASEVMAIRSQSQLAAVVARMRTEVGKVLKAHFADVFQSAAKHNGSRGIGAINAAETFAVAEADRIINRMAEYTRNQLFKALTPREALFQDLTTTLKNVFGQARIQRIITTSTTRAESKGIEFVASLLDIGQVGQLAGVQQRIDVGSLLGRGLAREPSANAGEIAEPTTVEGFETRRLKLIWRLNPLCKHCIFCPLIAGTDSLFYKRFVEAPPAHINCCCNVEIMPADFEEKKRPSVIEVLSAAREIGLI